MKASCSPASRHLCAGFTLVELLTVVAITGILVAILIPVLSAVRQAASTARDLGNLRQLAPAFTTFAGDHKNRYPLSYITGQNTPMNNWWYALAPYLGQSLPSNLSWASIQTLCRLSGPLGDPSLNITNPPFQMSTVWSSYAMPNNHRTYMTDYGPAPISATNVGLPVLLVKNPSTALLVADCRNSTDFTIWQQCTATILGLDYRHAGKANVLFSDGHVTSLTPAYVQQNWSTLFTNAIGQ